MTTNQNPDSSKKKHILVQVSIQLGCVVFILFSLLGILAYFSTAKGSQESFSATMTGMVPVYAASVDSWNEQFIRELHVYTKMDSVQNGDTESAVTWIRNHQDQRSADFSSVFFCDMQGKAHVDNGETTDISDRDYFSEMTKGSKDFVISNPVKSKIDNTAMYTVSVAVYDKNHAKIGFFAGIVSLNHLQNLAESVKVGESGYIVMFDNTGTCLAHPDKQNIMVNMKDSQNPGIRALVQQMMKGETNATFITNTRGEKSFVYYGPIKNTTWSIAAALPEREVTATAVQLGKNIALLCFLFFFILLGTAGLIVWNIINPLKNVDLTIRAIASGNADLTRRLDTTVNNEIGSIVTGFNEFVAKLQSIMTDLKTSKDDLSQNGSTLRLSIEETSSAITQILSDISGVKDEITSQSSSVEETASAITQISQNIVSLEKMIENQASGIVQASAAVEQMIGNITSVNKSVEQMAASFSSLEERSKSGISKQERVNEQISLISSQSQMLEDANTAIAAIAEQTNLLAMNAAIEAAHAGEAGKGFSVVADEIRKLSETSTIQSKTIGDELKKIQESIGTVVSASTETTDAFSSVSENIRETETLVLQIRNAMSEQLSGSQQINDALHMMNDSTAEVRTASAEMSTGQKSILEEVKRLQDATSSMKDTVSEMETGANKISETGSALDSIALNTNATIERIGSQIDQFKV
jgi:methyl-accepting chemotaxis protein